jgi:hypothetical protein
MGLALQQPRAKILKDGLIFRLIYDNDIIHQMDESYADIG